MYSKYADAFQQFYAFAEARGPGFFGAVAGEGAELVSGHQEACPKE